MQFYLVLFVWFVFSLLNSPFLCFFCFSFFFFIFTAIEKTHTIFSNLNPSIHHVNGTHRRSVDLNVKCPHCIANAVENSNGTDGESFRFDFSQQKKKTKNNKWILLHIYVVYKSVKNDVLLLVSVDSLIFGSNAFYVLCICVLFCIDINHHHHHHHYYYFRSQNWLKWPKNVRQQTQKFRIQKKSWQQKINFFFSSVDITNAIIAQNLRNRYSPAIVLIRTFVHFKFISIFDCVIFT